MHINELESQVMNVENLECTIKEQKITRESYMGYKEDLLKKKTKLEQEQKEISLYNDLKAEKEKYENICQEYENRKKDLDTAKKYFPNNVPREEAIREYGKKALEYKADMSSLDSIKESGYFNIFPNNIPDYEHIAAIKKIAREYVNINNDIKRKEDKLEILETVNANKKNKNRINIPMLIVAILLVITAVMALVVYTNIVVAIIMIFAGIVAGILAFVNLKKSRASDSDDSLTNIYREIEDDKKILNTYDEEISAFAKEYGLKKEECTTEGLIEFERKINSYNQIHNLKKKCDETYAFLVNFLEKYGIEISSDSQVLILV